MTHSTDNSAGSTVGAPITGEQPTPRQPLLRVDDLHVDFQTYGGVVQAVRGVSFEVAAGQTLAIVGESGCGKSVTVQSLMGLIPMPPGRIHKGTATLRGHDILASKFVGGQDIRGREISMIFQDPMTSLNPTMTIGRQIAETLEVHRGYSQSQAFNRAVELLEMSKIPEAAKRAKQYPFEFSGGMLQRAMIAMAIACEPAILGGGRAYNGLGRHHPSPDFGLTRRPAAGNRHGHYLDHPRSWCGGTHGRRRHGHVRRRGC
jgi:ABC-type microcin C transport system duplicated ATPase subunit YejF